MQAQKFKKSELRKIIQELENLDYKYKIGLIDINIGLETILCTYCSQCIDKKNKLEDNKTNTKRKNDKRTQEEI